MKLKEKGLYVAENLSSGQQYLLVVKGKSPMLRVANVLDLSQFAQYDVNTNQPASTCTINELISSIERTCDNFDWIPLQVKLDASTPTAKASKSNLQAYQVFSKNYENYVDLLTHNCDNQVVIDVSTTEDVPVEVATELVKQFRASLSI